jgi:large subunit ribosomal protein LP0
MWWFPQEILAWTPPRHLFSRYKIKLVQISVRKIKATHTASDTPIDVVFQVLNIPTKINKGSVEIVAPVELIRKGDRVGSSEAALLSKLGIRPFSYGLVITGVYDAGSVFSPEVLDLIDQDLIDKFATGVSMVASLSLALSYPTLAAAPHLFINGYKNVLAVAVELADYSYPHADQIKEYLKVNPKTFNYLTV